MSARQTAYVLSKALGIFAIFELTLRIPVLISLVYMDRASHLVARFSMEEVVEAAACVVLVFIAWTFWFEAERFANKVVSLEQAPAKQVDMPGLSHLVFRALGLYFIVAGVASLGRALVPEPFLASDFSLRWQDFLEPGAKLILGAVIYFAAPNSNPEGNIFHSIKDALNPSFEEDVSDTN